MRGVVDVISLEEERLFIAKACLNVSVQTVVANISLATGEHFDLNFTFRAGEVEIRAHLVKWRLPMQLACHIAPKLFGILNARLVHGLVLLQ